MKFGIISPAAGLKTGSQKEAVAVQLDTAKPSVLRLPYILSFFRNTNNADAADKTDQIR
jgi:hypothetical protein